MRISYWLAMAIVCIQILAYPSQVGALSMPRGGEHFSNSSVQLLAAAEPGFEDSIDAAFGDGARDATEGRTAAAEGEPQQVAGETEAIAVEDREVAERAIGSFETASDGSPDRGEDVSSGIDAAARQAREQISADIDFVRDVGEDTGSQIERTTEVIVEGVKDLFGGE